MPSEKFKKLIIFLLLGLLTISAFFIRLDNFRKSQLRSIDEIVYYRIARQVSSKGLSGYNTIPYGQELAATGRRLPPYFFEPLFKHPPLYSFLSALSIQIFGKSLQSAYFISLLFGVMTIPLVYLLGTLIFSRSVGILSAIVFSLDPFSIICSQKVWLETAVAFFIALSVYFFIKALKLKTDNNFLLSGLASGIGANFKYTGGLGAAIMFLYAGLYDRNLFKNKNFLGSLILPIGLLLPWFLWNFSVYGVEYLGMQIQLHSDSIHVTQVLKKVGILIVAFLLCLRLFFKLKAHRDEIKNGLTVKSHFPYTSLMKMIIGLAMVGLLYKEIALSFVLTHLPKTSWAGGTFYGATPTFYFGRLLEFSLIYFFAFLSFFIPAGKPDSSLKVSRLGILVILFFYILWGSYQSRYIIACIPLLVILGSHFLLHLYSTFSNSQSFFLRAFLKPTIIVVIIFIVAKMSYINEMISFPNDLCYF